MVIVGDFNIPLLSIDNSSRQKNQYRNTGLLYHMDITYILRTFHLEGRIHIPKCV